MPEGRDASHVAYFSMEMALDSAMPTYSGGLGVLAGDTMRAAADAGLRMVGVTILYNEGYFTQVLDVQGKQLERPVTWEPEDFLELMDAKVTISIEGRDVAIRAWRYTITGVQGHKIDVYLLDTDLEENTREDRELTARLYAGDVRHRLRQEMVLGPGGRAMLRELGYTDVPTFHMNEGHSALLVFSLFQEELAASPETDPAILMQRVRDRCVFTTHTPVPAGHDQFGPELVEKVLGKDRFETIKKYGCLLNGQLNMTYLGLHCSRYINGVSMRHEQVTEDMFPGYPVDSVTNGVHAVTWIAPPFRELFDRHIPEWRKDNRYLRYAVGIKHTEIMDAHLCAKKALMEEVRIRTGVTLDPGVMTVSFARRATPYKRADLLLSDIDRLKKIANDVGPLQVIYAGKAHPKDEEGKKLISRIFQLGDQLRGDVRVVYIPDYGMRVASHLVAGVDLWVNTPNKPREASGTSGMKAAMNGVPSLSVLDGWWIEGHIENITGWSIGETWRDESDDAVEAESLFDKLEYVILPMFYDRPDDFAHVMRYCISLNGSFFSAQRMLSQYVHNVYQVEAPLHDPMG